MRGGTVLHKAHLAPASRYSEDIDLVLVKAMNTDTLDQHLRRVLTPLLGQPTDSLIADAWLAIRNVLRPSRILRTAYNSYTGHLRSKPPLSAAFRTRSASIEFAQHLMHDLDALQMTIAALMQTLGDQRADQIDECGHADDAVEEH